MKWPKRPLSFCLIHSSAGASLSGAGPYSIVSNSLATVATLYHWVTVRGGVAPGHEVLELPFDVRQQGAGTQPEQRGPEPAIPQLFLHKDQPVEGLLCGRRDPRRKAGPRLADPYEGRAGGSLAQARAVQAGCQRLADGHRTAARALRDRALRRRAPSPNDIKWPPLPSCSRRWSTGRRRKATRPRSSGSGSTTTAASAISSTAAGSSPPPGSIS